MSLNPTWFSTIFGVYFFAGSFLSALSHPGDRHLAGEPERTCSAAAMNVEHTHSIGKLMLAFTCFWTYIALLAAAADLDRGPARGDPVLHHALPRGLELASASS